MYDWVIDIDLLDDICQDGWKVYLSDRFASLYRDMFYN